MKLSSTQHLILYALGKFYETVNQPLVEKPIKVHTSKITFIELLKQSPHITKQPRTIYKNLEQLEQKKLIAYNNHLITLTKQGLTQLQTLQQELNAYHNINLFFQQQPKPKRKLQTVIEGL